MPSDEVSPEEQLELMGYARDGAEASLILTGAGGSELTKQPSPCATAYFPLRVAARALQVAARRRHLKFTRRRSTGIRTRKTPSKIWLT